MWWVAAQHFDDGGWIVGNRTGGYGGQVVLWALRWCRRHDNVRVGHRWYMTMLVRVVSMSLKAQGCRSLEAKGSCVRLNLEVEVVCNIKGGW